MSFAHTGSGARFIALWGQSTPSRQLRLGLRHPDLFPFELFTVTDDRGSRYELDFTPGDGPEWTSEINLRPAPPDDVRWLDVAAPLSPAVRIDLAPERLARERRAGCQRGEAQPGRASADHARGVAAHGGAGVPARPAAGAARALTGAVAGHDAPRSATSSPGSRPPTSCHRSARSPPGSPRCAPACASAGTGSPRRPRMTCRNPGSACWPTTSAGNRTRHRCATATRRWRPRCPNWTASGWPCSACTTPRAPRCCTCWPRA